MKFFRSQNPVDPSLVETSSNKTNSDELPITGKFLVWLAILMLRILKSFFWLWPVDSYSHLGSDADGESSPSIKTKETQLVLQLKEGMPDSYELEPERKLQNKVWFPYLLVSDLLNLDISRYRAVLQAISINY